MKLKVSVLSNGSILLDGTPVALANLKTALEQADRSTGGVLYYRENAGAEPPPESRDVMDLVIANKLPISLSSKPDFSDYVDRFGQLHSRTADHETGSAFATARAQAAGRNGNRGIAIVRPDRAVLFLTLPAPSPETSGMAKQGRNIAVIGSTEFTMPRAQELPSLQEASHAIPFFGILCGLSRIGHNISIFDGHPSALAPGLEQSEILIVDSAMLPSLPPDWMQVAQRIMQGDPRIFIHERKAGRLVPAKPLHDSLEDLQ